MPWCGVRQTSMWTSASPPSALPTSIMPHPTGKATPELGTRKFCRDNVTNVFRLTNDWHYDYICMYSLWIPKVYTFLDFFLVVKALKFCRVVALSLLRSLRIVASAHFRMRKLEKSRSLCPVQGWPDDLCHVPAPGPAPVAEYHQGIEKHSRGSVPFKKLSWPCPLKNTLVAVSL